MIGSLIRNVVLPLGFLAGGVVVFLSMAKLFEKPPALKEVDDRTQRVEVVLARPAPPDAIRIRVNGTIVPRREVSLSAEVEGRVVERTDACWAGRTVKAGDLLLKLDTRPLELQREAAQAELAQVAADLEQLDVEVENTEQLVTLAEQDLELRRREQVRVQQTIARGASSPSERDAADALVLTSRQNLQMLQNDRRTFASRRARLEAQRKRIEAQLDQVAYDLERTTIASPVDGRIVEVRVERDSYARPGDLLVTIEDTASMEVRCSLRLEDLYWLAGGQDPLSLVGDDPYEVPSVRASVSRSLEGKTRSWDGVLSRFEGSGFDERTRTVPCRIAIPEPAGLRRGMFVSIDLFGTEADIPLLAIPRTALRSNNRVWAVSDDSRLEIRPVHQVGSIDDALLIRGDGPGTPIAAGTPVIVSSLNAEIPGMKVAVVNPSGEALASDDAPDEAALDDSPADDRLARSGIE